MMIKEKRVGAALERQRKTLRKMLKMAKSRS
jgi:hypothetical protein